MKSFCTFINCPNWPLLKKGNTSMCYSLAHNNPQCWGTVATTKRCCFLQLTIHLKQIVLSHGGKLSYSLVLLRYFYLGFFVVF